MAAADYYKAPLTMRTYEEKLEIQAQDIDQQTLLVESHLRGFLLRRRVSRHCKDDESSRIRDIGPRLIQGTLSKRVAPLGM